jgi:hypothetical protein
MLYLRPIPPPIFNCPPEPTPPELIELIIGEAGYTPVPPVALKNAGDPNEDVPPAAPCPVGEGVAPPPPAVYG